VNKRAVLGVLVLGQLAVWLDNTILNVALRTLADPVRGLGASSGELEWGVGAYPLVFAALLFTGGVLGDRFGRVLTLTTGTFVFGAASAWAAYAGSARELIAARGVMGVGSALVLPATLSIITNVFGPAERPKAIAVWSGSSGLAIAGGPLLGGLLLEHFWWGSVFLVNVPLVALTLLGCALILPESRDRAAGRFDPGGLALSAAALFGLVYGIIRGGQVGSWARFDVLGPIAGGLALLWGFVALERRQRQPSLDIRLFRERTFTGASLAVMLCFFGLLGSMFYAVFYLQTVRGLAPLRAGGVLLPVAFGVALGAAVGERLVARFGVPAVCAPGLALVAATLYGYAGLGLHTDLWGYRGLLLAQGIGIGVVMAPTTEAMLAALPREKAGAGSAVNNALRQVGGVLGVAVLGSVLADLYQQRISPRLATIPATVLPPPARAAAGSTVEATASAAAAAGRADLLAAADSAYLRAMHVTTVVGAAVVALGVLVVLVFFRPSDGRAEPPQPKEG
jgi:EmrB/QacA subfamily drug resistance transporter